MDNLSCNIIEFGEFKSMIGKKGICGIIFNFVIFEKAIVGNVIYDVDIEVGIKVSKLVIEIYEFFVFKDICDVCDIFMLVYEEIKGLDGYISIEVLLIIVKDIESIISEVICYYMVIGCENLMIKIFGILEGLLVVMWVISEGINVNVILLFFVESYINIVWVYIEGLEVRVVKGEDIDKIVFVVSFFLSCIDSNIDGLIDEKFKKVIDEIVKVKLEVVKGKVAIVNVKIVY